MALKLPERNTSKSGEPKQSARARMSSGFEQVIPGAVPAADPFPPAAPAVQAQPAPAPAASQVVDLDAPVPQPTVRLRQPAATKPRAKRPVTREKMSLVLDKATKQRFLNTFAYLNRTGQADRYSHVAAQALNDFCERIENDYNGGERFPAEEQYIAPTGAPKRQAD